MTAWRSSETAMGMSPRISRTAVSARPSGSTSSSPAIAPWKEMHAPSTSAFSRIDSTNSSIRRSRSGVATGPPETAQAAKVGITSMSDLSPNTLSMPAISVRVSRRESMISGPRRTWKSSYRVLAGLKVAVSCFSSAMRIRFMGAPGGCAGCYQIVKPPSTTMSAPVTKLDASEARKTATGPSSSGSPARPIGVAASHRPPYSGSLSIGAVMSVRM